MDNSSNEKRDPRAFVCGWPIEHSRSPLIHTYWLEQFQISGSYQKQAIEPQNFSAFLAAIKTGTFVGGNITIPHKEMALGLVDKIDEAAKQIGAVNTVWVENGDLIGSNTDWIGFAANLDQYAPGWDSAVNGQIPVLVIGAGGAARGILYALLQRGFTNIILANRTVEKAEKLAEEFGPSILPISIDGLSTLVSKFALVVNTSSLGMAGHAEMPQFILDLVSRLDHETLVTDIVYVPLKTEFLKLAENQGLKIVDGLGMLLHQAVPGFEKWFGKRPVVTDELRKLVIADMEKTL